MRGAVKQSGAQLACGQKQNSVADAVFIESIEADTRSNR